MDFRAFSRTKWALPVRTTAVALFLAACTVGALGLTSGPARAVQSGLAYDEVTKLVTNDQAPQPGTFAADFQAAMDAQKSANAPGKHGGLFGGILNAADIGKGAMQMLKAGSASTHYYMAGWERTDESGAQTAKIFKPDQHQIIYLNLAKKTYRVVDTTVQPVSETPPPYERARRGPPGGPGGPGGPSPQPGSGKLDISVSTSVLGPKLVENVPTTGYKMTFTLSETQSTGSCVDGSFQTSMVEYVSKYAEPHVASPGAPTGMPRRSDIPRPETMAMRPGCTPTITTHASVGSAAPGGLLAMWLLASFNLSAQSAQGPMGGGFSTLIERGNVRVLGPADMKLFEIPSDFSKEQ